MTLAQQRIQDPILTQLAHGYYNDSLICESLFPIVEMPKEGGKIPTFGRLAFRNISTVRQLHGDSNRLTPEDVQAISVELDEHDIEYPIDYREANEASYDLKSYALQTTQNIIGLKREILAAELAQDPENYLTGNKLALSGSNQFNHADSDPISILLDACEKVRANTGLKPNLCVISADVWKVLRQHKAILEITKYTQSGILTTETLSKILDVETVKIGGAMEEKDGILEPIWKNCVIFAYTPAKNSIKSIYAPSYGYTVRRNKGLFVDTYQEKGGKVEIIRCTDIHKPILVGKEAGFLLTNCLS